MALQINLKRVLITGANGFVGKALCEHLRAAGWDVVAAVRNPNSESEIKVESIGRDTPWGHALKHVSCVIHLAARVHVMSETVADPLVEFRAINVDGTLNLASQAVQAGVKRFIFLSTVKVLGESTQPSRSFQASDMPNPEDAYGISKWAAEQGLHRLAAQTAMEMVIVRSPLVYGPGVKANFASLVRWLRLGIPLPLGAVTQNRRSLVALDNLVDLLATCIDHPAAANQTFMVSDGEDLSTADLLHRLGQAMGQPARLIAVPSRLLLTGACMLGKRDLAQRLLGNLQVDISKTRELLGWAPPVRVDEGLRRAVPRVKTNEALF
ncbi:MAG: hypothetical protein CK604_05250 [Curvibacter sp. PD_MW3]|nr:MAG: hypothetical protein CK604_05250 [Curvibacter sp. PD_MW3]